jgi:hypothetical protein
MPYGDPPVADAEGKDCNVFHCDYRGLATDSLGRVHVVDGVEPVRHDPTDRPV